MWRQHDVYYQALRIIEGTCQEFIRFAHGLIGEAGKGWVTIDRFDHRTLQASHDLLAAVWRYRYEHKVRQMELPGFRPCRNYLCPLSGDVGEVNLERLWKAGLCWRPNCQRLAGDEYPDFAGHWLDWLRNEVRSWEHSPYLIRRVIEILANQNKPVGYRAEDALRCNLMADYSDVPWTRR